MKINLMPFWRALGELLKLRKSAKPTFNPPVIVLPKPKPVIVQLPRLVRRGRYFALDTGARFTAIECSDFNLLGRLVHEGPDVVRDVLAERASMGFNLLRVWTRYEGNEDFTNTIGYLLPSVNPELYAKIPVLCSMAAEEGLYLELTAYTGGANDDHWERLAAALKGVSNAIVDGANEIDDYDNDVDEFALTDIPDVLCSRGSYVQSIIPPRPWMQYETMHTNESDEWWRKGSHNGMELTEGTEGIVASGVPVLINENERCDKDRNINHHEDAARACALLVAGSCFHSLSGKRSALFSDFDRPYAEAFVRGASEVPLEFQDGHYRHDSAWEGPDDLRVYRRVLDDGRYHEVRIRK